MLLSENIESVFKSLWEKIERDTKRAFFVLLTISLVAWGAELISPTFNVDDYGQSLRHAPPHWTKLGRWAADILYYRILGGWFSPFLHFFLGLVLNVAAVTVIVRLWYPKERPNSVPVIVACGLFLSFPYFCDAYSFNTGQVQIPLANLLAVGGYAVSRNTLRSVAIGAFLITLGLALYQISFNLLAVVVSFQLLFAFVHSQSFRQYITVIRSELLLKIAALPLGVALYAISLKVAFFCLPERNTRWQAFSDNRLIDSLADLGGKLARIYYYTVHHLLARDLLFTKSLKLAMSTLILIAILAALWALLLPPSKSEARRPIDVTVRLLKFVPLFFLLVGAVFICVYTTDMPITGSVLGIGFRHTYPIGAVYPGFFLLGMVLLRRGVLRNVYLLLAIVILARFVCTDNVWAFTQRQLNEFDDTLATRLLCRIESNPRFTRFEDFSVAFVGFLPNKAKPPGYSLFREGRIHSTLNRSVFQARHSLRQIFKTKGIDLKEPSKKQMKSAIRYARKHRRWPHAESVAIQDDLIIVVLGKEKNRPKTVMYKGAVRKGIIHYLFRE